MSQMPKHLIEQAWEQYRFHMLSTGAPEPSKMHFLGGVAAALGVIVGTIDCGIPEGTPSRDVIAQLINDELPRYQREINDLVEIEKRTIRQ